MCIPLRFIILYVLNFGVQYVAVSFFPCTKWMSAKANENQHASYSRNLEIETIVIGQGVLIAFYVKLKFKNSFQKCVLNSCSFQHYWQMAVKAQLWEFSNMLTNRELPSLLAKMSQQQTDHDKIVHKKVDFSLEHLEFDICEPAIVKTRNYLLSLIVHLQRLNAFRRHSS